MKEKEIKKEVKLLAKQKEFEQIYQQYGPTYFRKYVSHKYKKEDIRKLTREGKYLDIYEKYGKKELDYLFIYCKDIENEVGRKRSLPMKTVYKTKGWLKSLSIYCLVALISMTTPKEIMTVVNSQKYAKEIEEYTNKIKEYSKKFNIHTQSDLEIIMRTIKDMHETIRGYGDPEIDAIGFFGMDVMDENGIGVCKNMAGNIADKLNEIYPKYNARTITLYQKVEQFEQADIGETDRTLESKNNKGNQEENSSVDKIRENIGKIFGNHVMVLADIKKDNVTLVIDPTNIALGVLIDGKIIMFNETQLSEAIYDKKIIGTIQDNGIRGIVECVIDPIKSHREPTLSMKELEEKYGLEAQNKMLKQIEKADEENKEKRTDGKTFRQDYKVDKGVNYNFDTNTITIESNEEKEDDENQRGH